MFAVKHFETNFGTRKARLQLKAPAMHFPEGNPRRVKRPYELISNLIFKFFSKFGVCIIDPEFIKPVQRLKSI